jgi:hypothetical protein
MITISDILKIDNCEIFSYLQYGGFNKDDLVFPETKHIYWSNLRCLSSGDLKTRIEDNRISDLFLIPRYMQFGDYDNSCMVERSNKKVFLEEYGDSSIVYEATGGHGSESIALSIKELLNPDNEEKAQSIIDRLNALNDYPCIDDEDISNMEYEAFIEALNDYGIEDTCYELAKKYGITVYDFNEDKMKELILEIDRHGNPVYIIESGGLCYIDIKDSILPKITKEQFLSVLTDYEVVES